MSGLLFAVVPPSSILPLSFWAVWAAFPFRRAGGATSSPGGTFVPTFAASIAMSASPSVGRNAACSARVGIVGTRVLEGIVGVSNTIGGEDLDVDEDAPGSSGLLIVSTTALGLF